MSTKKLTDKQAFGNKDQEQKYQLDKEAIKENYAVAMFRNHPNSNDIDSSSLSIGYYDPSTFNDLNELKGERNGFTHFDGAKYMVLHDPTLKAKAASIDQNA